ncbi:hypothetical protein [Paractinoplanes atraurantiacus]|uniref:Uncharacterized protein n=1 Tax=Paractinoplanes atraurantiacus TaxID=1036182 RepID=A0A285IFW7_9ACTN|nr:hypothetical protein [Actinoplanes atraurantiacus]SNY46842.1 hypothetical protein SAMN05421748_10816 [Actinoplanes atraurantiacus]
MGELLPVTAAVVPCLSLLAVTWLAIPGLPPLPVGVAFAGGFAGIVLLIASGLTRRRRGSAGRRSLLVVAGVLAVALVALVIIVSATGPHPWPAGQPTIVDGGFFLDVHGSLAPITEAEYRADLKAEVAAFLCFAALLGIAALANLGLSHPGPAARRGRSRWTRGGGRR